MNDLKTMLTTDEASQQLKMSPQTLADWRWKSKGPKFVKVGRLVRYRQSDLDQWLQRQVTGGDSK